MTRHLLEMVERHTSVARPVERVQVHFLRSTLRLEKEEREET